MAKNSCLPDGTGQTGSTASGTNDLLPGSGPHRSDLRRSPPSARRNPPGAGGFLGGSGCRSQFVVEFADVRHAVDREESRFLVVSRLWRLLHFGSDGQLDDLDVAVQVVAVGLPHQLAGDVLEGDVTIVDLLVALGGTKNGPHTNKRICVHILFLSDPGQAGPDRSARAGLLRPRPRSGLERRQITACCRQWNEQTFNSPARGFSDPQTYCLVVFVNSASPPA